MSKSIEYWGRVVKEKGEKKNKNTQKHYNKFSVG